jgi:hypothetical protein
MSTKSSSGSPSLLAAWLRQRSWLGASSASFADVATGAGMTAASVWDRAYPSSCWEPGPALRARALRPGPSRRPRRMPRRGRLLRRSGANSPRHWQPSPRSWNRAACRHRQGVTVGHRPRSRAFWRPSLRSGPARPVDWPPIGGPTPATLATVATVGTYRPARY